MHTEKEFGQFFLFLFLQNSSLALFTAERDLSTQRDHFGQIELFEEMEQLCEVLQGQFVSVEENRKNSEKYPKILNEGKAG